MSEFALINEDQSTSSSTPIDLSVSPKTKESTPIQPAPKKRVRTGCLNCRRKHKKCDETKPICTSCLSKNEICKWPLSKSKNNTYNEFQSSLDLESFQQAKRQRVEPILNNNTFIPNFQQFTEPIKPKQPMQNPDLIQIFNSLETLLIRFLIDAEPITNVPAPQVVTPPLNSYEEIITMKYYIHNLSGQLDWVHQDSTIFRIDIPHLTRSSNVLRNAVYASSLIHQSNQSKTHSPICSKKMLSIFEKSVLELAQDPQQGTTTIRITSAFFLLTFCLNMCNDPIRWKDLVSALLTYLQREGTHQRDKHPINNSIYWIAISLDICCTKVFEESTLVAHDFENLEGLSPVPSILSYISMTFNLLELNQPQNDFESKWEKIWVHLTNFANELIASKERVFLGPIMDRADDKSPFPMVLQSSAAAVLFQQCYLILKILLIQDRPRIFKNKHIDSHQPAWYAKRLCSISIWNKEYMNNLVTPLALNIAGKVLTHEDEHQAIIAMLDEINSNSWCVLKYSKQDLLDFWGS